MDVCRTGREQIRKRQMLWVSLALIFSMGGLALGVHFHYFQKSEPVELLVRNSTVYDRPFYDETVPNWLLYTSVVSITILISAIIGVCSRSCWKCLFAFLTLVLAIVSSQTATTIVKSMALSPRPYADRVCSRIYNVYNGSGGSYDMMVCDKNRDALCSFFSGHASISAAVAVAAVIILYREDRKLSLLHFFLALFAAYVGLSRIADNKHFGIDVAVGLGVGAACGAWSADVVAV